VGHSRACLFDGSPAAGKRLHFLYEATGGVVLAPGAVLRFTGAEMAHDAGHEPVVCTVFERE